MARRSKLEQRTLAFLRGVCRRVRIALATMWDDPKTLETVLEMCRKMTEQVWLATHDPLNIFGTGQERRENPQHHKRGADWCVCHFIETAGFQYHQEYEAGLR